MQIFLDIKKPLESQLCLILIRVLMSLVICLQKYLEDIIIDVP